MNKLFIFFLVCLFHIHAQQNCKLILDKLKIDYLWGKIEHIEQSLLSCESLLSKDDKISAYRLLCLRFIHDQQLVKAKRYLLEWLTLDPYAAIEKENNTTLDILIQKVNLQIHHGWGGQIQLSHVLFLKRQEYVLSPGANKNIAYFKSINYAFTLFGFQALSTLNYLQYGVSYQNENLRYIEEVFTYSRIEGRTIDHRLEVFLGFKRKLFKSKIHWYLQGYLIGSTFLTSKIHLKRRDQWINGTEKTEEVKAFKISNEKRRFNMGLGLRLEGSFPLKSKKSIGLYLFGRTFFWSTTQASKRYLNNDLIYRFFRIEGDKIPFNIGAGIYLTLNQFKPRFYE